ncbi:MAG: hypothetical protein LBC33_00875, partial [Mycoplasmataceae bacterium]|nr:hypothetical protein [Mycoplasmataceae bacterium]
MSSNILLKKMINNWWIKTIILFSAITVIFAPVLSIIYWHFNQQPHTLTVDDIYNKIKLPEEKNVDEQWVNTSANNLSTVLERINK